jgi:PKD repeat protein
MGLKGTGREIARRLGSRPALALWGTILLGLGLCLALVVSVAPGAAQAGVDGPAPAVGGRPASESAGGAEPGYPAGAESEPIQLETLELDTRLTVPASVLTETEELWAIGFVFYDGVPVEGATGTLESEHGSLTLTTQPGPLSEYPYFTATLSAPPLAAELGDLIELEVSYGGETNFASFMVLEGMQQVFGWLSSTCGPTEITGEVISENTTWVQECGPYILTGDVLIQDPATLTIAPGTSLLLDTDCALRADGILWAEGSTNAMISLMPYSETEHWGYVLLSGGPSRIWAARMERGGGADVADNGTIRVDGADASLAYVTIRESESNGVRIYNDAAVDESFLDISDSGGWGIYAETDDSSFSIIGCELKRNEEGGIRVRGGVLGQISSNLCQDNGGSGIWVRGGDANVIVAYNTCQGNEADTGGGIWWYNAAGSIVHNIVRENSASGYNAHGGGIYVETYQVIEVRDNIILDNVALERGGGVYLTQAEARFERNVLDGNTAEQGGAIYVASAKPDSYVRLSAILRNEAEVEGGAVYVDDVDAMTHNNTILWNTAGEGHGAIQLADATAIVFNNLYGNAPYDVVNDDVDDASAANCWWNTTDTDEIDARIWDFLDDSGVGWVDYMPFMEQNNPLAPMAPPTGLVATSGLSITAQWDPTADLPFDGYLLYYEPVAGGFPYTGTGAIEGDSPIDVGDVTSYTLSGLPDGTYYLAVTARDPNADGEDDWTEGYESWFSDPAVAQVGGAPKADFQATPRAGTAPLTVTFTNASTGIYDTCLWDLGDGESSSDCGGPVHAYAAGTYTVSLTVSGTGGTDMVTRPGYITAYAPGEGYRAYLPALIRQP